jgi:hypothetical protein
MAKEYRETDARKWRNLILMMVINVQKKHFRKRILLFQEILRKTKKSRKRGINDLTRGR